MRVLVLIFDFGGSCWKHRREICPASGLKKKGFGGKVLGSLVLT